MAILSQPVSTGNVFANEIGDDLAPVGTFVATVLEIKDEFGVVRPKYEEPAEMETVDLTTFLFGFRDADGQPHRIASKRMKISGHEKSALYGMLKSLTGAAWPYGQDYCTLKGRKCLLTVEHVQKRDGSGVFAAVATLSPVPVGFNEVAPRPAAPAPAPHPTVPNMPSPPPPPPKRELPDPIPF